MSSYLRMIARGDSDRRDRGHPQGSGKGWRPWKPQCTVAVTGVTERTKKTALQEAFGEFGRIIRIEVPDGKTLAFVEYEERRDASDAIKTMNGKMVEGRRIGVRLVEDLPPKIDRNAPRHDSKIVHAPAQGRKDGPWNGARGGSPEDPREGRRRSPGRGRSRSRSPPRQSGRSRGRGRSPAAGSLEEPREGRSRGSRSGSPPRRSDPRRELRESDRPVRRQRDASVGGRRR